MAPNVNADYQQRSLLSRLTMFRDTQLSVKYVIPPAELFGQPLWRKDSKYFNSQWDCFDQEGT